MRYINSILPLKSGVQSIFLGLLLFGLSHTLSGQRYTDKISRTLSTDKPPRASVLAIENINGSIRVAGYRGKDIQLEADRIIEAKDQGTAKRLKEIKKEVSIGIIRTNDSLIVYIKGPFDHYLGENGRIGYNLNKRKEDYSFRFDFTLKVPQTINLLLSTINEGAIEVENVQGQLTLYNINGAIHMEQIAGSVKARTINGNVEVTHKASPALECTYTSLNGKVMVSYPGDLSADLFYHNTNGSFYTNFPVAEYLPAKVEKKQKPDGSRTAYRVESNSAIRIGKGGPRLYFEAMNGDIMVKKTGD